MSIKLKKFDRDCFFDYVKMFYGKGETTNYFTDKEINVGIDEYLEIVTKSYWGDGDTADRENVFIIMMSNRHNKIEKEIKKLKKQLTQYPKLKEKTLKNVCEVVRGYCYTI
jgi:hypothetical protein